MHSIIKDMHAFNNYEIVQPTTNAVIYSIDSLSRKVMLYPDPDNLDSPSCYVIIDFQRLLIQHEPDTSVYGHKSSSTPWFSTSYITWQWQVI